MELFAPLAANGAHPSKRCWSSASRLWNYNAFPRQLILGAPLCFAYKIYVWTFLWSCIVESAPQAELFAHSYICSLAQDECERLQSIYCWKRSLGSRFFRCGYCAFDCELWSFILKALPWHSPIRPLCVELNDGELCVWINRPRRWLWSIIVECAPLAVSFWAFFCSAVLPLSFVLRIYAFF